MPALMAGCDALVENAGGLTSLEAMRAGLAGRQLPAHRRPRPGEHGPHGRGRREPPGPRRLTSSSTPSSRSPRRAGSGRPGRCGTGHVPRPSGPPDPRGGAGPRAGASPAPAGGLRRAGRRPPSSLAAALAWTGLTSGVDVAAAAAGRRRRPSRRRAPTMVAYVGVRLNAAELADRTIGGRPAAHGPHRHRRQRHRPDRARRPSGSWPPWASTWPAAGGATGPDGAGHDARPDALDPRPQRRRSGPGCSAI